MKNFTYILNFGHFYKYFLMFKTFHLSVLKFGFLLLCLFHTKNHNEMLILFLTPKLKLCRFENDVILELRVKLIFFCTKLTKWERTKVLYM
jgi:hypothetical protein